MQQDHTLSAPYDADDWVDELRERLVDDGHDQRRVDRAIDTSLTRFRGARVRSFLPLLVERADEQALRAE